MSEEESQNNSMVGDNLKPIGLRPHPRKFIFNPIVIVLTAVILVLTIALGVVVVTSSSFGKRQCNTEESVENKTNTGIKKISASTPRLADLDIIDAGKVLRIVTRDEWQAEPMESKIEYMLLPARKVVITDTGSEDCTSLTTCAAIAISIQYVDKYAKHYDDIGYNFLIGGDGNVYEGRGWDHQGLGIRGYNAESIGIAFIGGFRYKPPPERQLNAAKLLIDEGVRLRKFADDYRVYGARQLLKTSSPGDALFEEIKKWPKWTADA